MWNIIKIHRIHQKYKLGYAFFLEFQEEDRCRIDNPPFSTKFYFQIYVRGGDPFIKKIQMYFIFFENFNFSETCKNALKILIIEYLENFKCASAFP